MKTLLYMFISLTWLSGFLCDPQLAQSDPVVVKPGSSHTLSCTGSGFTFSSHWMHWIRQVPGASLQWLSYINSDGSGTNYDDSVKGRFTISRDNSNNKVYLLMTNMKTEDTSAYYCVAWGGTMDIWGQGTMVTVTSEEIITPDVFPMISAGHKDSNFFAFGCLAYKFFPQPVTTTWETLTGQVPLNITNFPPIEFRDPFSYSVFSQVTVSKTEWNSNTYQCTVNHLSSSIQRTVTKAGCDTPPESPTVYLMQGTCPESSYGKVELTCLVYNLTTQDAQVKWFINNIERALQQDLLELGKSKNNFYVLSSTVSISQAEWNNGVPVKCHVTDKNTKKSAEDTTKKCSDNINCLGINVFMVPPSIEDLYVVKTARILCVASNLKDTNGLTFDWSYPGGPSSLQFQTEDPILNDNGTFSVISVLTVTPYVWNQNTEITCKFRHPQLSTPIITTISKRKDETLSPPTVSLSLLSPEELEKKEKYTLLCAVYNHNPKDLYIGWMKNGYDLSKDEFVTSDSKIYVGGENYCTFSIATILATSWESNDSYSCIVGHEALPMNFIRRSIDKSSGKPTVVNVSVNMSESTLTCF